MKCPACNKPMIVVEHESIELDYCLSCLGVWFDSGELELLLESMQVQGSGLALKDILAAPEARCAEKKRKCPICRTKMKKETVGTKPEVLIDACPRGDGLWFDKGEVGQLVTQLPDKASGDKESQGKIFNFLGEVFKSRDKSQTTEPE